MLIIEATYSLILSNVHGDTIAVIVSVAFSWKGEFTADSDELMTTDSRWGLHDIKWLTNDIWHVTDIDMTFD